MEPKYSILFCNQKLDKYFDKIGGWLKEGIKIFWFGNHEDAQKLRDA